MLRRSPARRLATVLFVDIVDSTRIATEMGDRPWRDLVAAFRTAVRRELRRHGGHEQDTAGDGFFATFDQPALALRAAVAIVAAVQQLGLDVRCGLHAGELERIDGRSRVLVDATQSVPFVSLASYIERIDYLLVSAYKHLLCPRGVAFLAGRAERLAELAPLDANWKAATEPYGRFFGGPLTLPNEARRLDVSLAWLPWLGAVESLRLLASWAPTGAFEGAGALARELADRLGVEWGGASLVCAPLADPDAARDSLRAAGIRVSVRGAGIRCATHVYTSPDDIDRAARAIAPFLQS